jgi:small subunit ribosomal protein S20
VAHHKSALKRNRQNIKRNERNRARRSRMKTYVKKVVSAVEDKDLAAAKAAFQEAAPEIARAASKGALKKKTASRKISRLAKAVHKLTASTN